MKGLGLDKLVGAALVLCLGACSMDRTEADRVLSPDKKKIAVLIRGDFGGGAGNTEWYVYLSDRPAEQKFDHPIFQAGHCGGVSVAWKENAMLSLKYPAGCDIRQFTNYWYADKARYETKVEIVLTRIPEEGSAAQ